MRLRHLKKLSRYPSILGSTNGIRWAGLRIADRYNFIPISTKMVNVPEVEYPMTVRVGGSSDPKVFDQIFIDREFEPLVERVRDPRVIVDLGANVGFSSVFFLNVFPNAFVLAVEPDPENAAICEQNLAPYGDRARLVKAAVWDKPDKLVLSRGTFRDGNDWATEVRQARPGEIADVEALDIPGILQMCPVPLIDLLKIDIEGSETALFREHTGWLKSVGNICIELHNSEAGLVIEEALRRFRFKSVRSGEYNMYLNIQRV